MKNTLYIMGTTLGCMSAMTSGLPADSGPTSSAPFHDCLDSGKSWQDCSAAANSQLQELKRDAPTTTSPFHDCLDTGKSWQDCAAAAHGLETSAKLARSGLDERGLARNILGAVGSVSGTNFGQAEKCYSVNSLGETGWLTNTAVEALRDTACSYAIDQAINAAGASQPSIGKYTTIQPGYWQANAGPEAWGKVNFYLSTVFQGGWNEIKNTDIHDLGVDLCKKAIDHLTADAGCTADRKAGKSVEHTSVNGGEFNFARNSANKAIDPIFDGTGICTNCILSLFMEAANFVDKDGSTVTPTDTRRDVEELTV